MRLTDFPDTINLAFDKTELTKDGRDEPRFPAAVAADFTETTRLDPTRVELNPEKPRPKRRIWRGSIGSLLLHLLPLLALISWLRPPLAIPTPIPVQLVIEQPPPPPPAEQPPRDSPAPPAGLRASDDFGQTGPSSPEKATDTAPPAQDEPAPATEAEAQTAPQPPEPPVESPQPTPAATAPPVPPKPTPPKPTPPKRQMAARVPMLEGLELPLPLHPDRPHPASASARYPGPNATHDEYCAYALSLTMRHVDLLPLSLLGARRGDTTVTIRVRQDGTIINARVVQGSGYLDVDERVAEMVRAVRQFPPLPLWVPGPVADFTFHFHFPNPAER
jgi:protein TonB